MTESEFVTIVEENSKRVFLIALSFTKNKSDAEDIMQDVFLKLWKHNKSFESKEHLTKWLTVVTSNESKNLLRRISRRKETDLEDISNDFTFSSEESRNIFDTVMALPPKLALVIHLFYYEDMSVRDIADTLGISEGAVKTRLNRGREKLKIMLKGEYTDE